MTTKRAIRVNAGDNVVTVLNDVSGGETVQVMEKDGGTSDLLVLDAIPFGHKAAWRSIATGQDVVKYGESIGVATREIVPGQHVHVHNVDSKRGKA